MHLSRAVKLTSYYMGRKGSLQLQLAVNNMAKRVKSVSVFSILTSKLRWWSFMNIKAQTLCYSELFSQKWKFCHYLFSLIPFKNHMTYCVLKIRFCSCFGCSFPYIYTKWALKLSSSEMNPKATSGLIIIWSHTIVCMNIRSKFALLFNDNLDL